MARAMFEYTKKVLNSVSFDVHLFSKEVEKAVKRLLPYEIEELRLYVLQLIKTNPQLQSSLLYLPK
ncbi:hypothetical protein [Psychroflexus salis]|uniref:Uncharacterized protein n=1 Tax=Psychroflexus salis TaxID=1526574 RepID=A0A917A0T3_9FLAO|nr:hypothetical protein [Psychroflexus salis]GGE20228.1 hypothetical protein GCM10010831_21670 [Psychroflexus salis]